MLGVGNGFYIQTSGGADSRILYPAKLLGGDGSNYSAEIEEQGLTLEEEQNVLVFYEIGQKFVKQAAKITAVSQCEGENPTIGFRSVGEPVSAEGRQHYRVSTAAVDLTAALGVEKQCRLLDVSSIGFSVFATKEHAIGATLDAGLFHRGDFYSGQVCIQSIRDMGDGRIRYGLHCVDDKHTGANLEQGLRTMTMDIQRKQLRRLARAT